MTSDKNARNRMLKEIETLRSTRDELINNHQVALSKIETELHYAEYYYNLAWEHAENTPLPTDINELDFTNAKTQADKLVQIALTRRDRTLNATDTAHLFMRLGLTNAKKRHIVGRLFQLMDESDDWEKVSPGTFAYRGTLN